VNRTTQEHHSRLQLGEMKLGKDAASAEEMVEYTLQVEVSEVHGPEAGEPVALIYGDIMLVVFVGMGDLLELIHRG
jgi:hypothetical protein